MNHFQVVPEQSSSSAMPACPVMSSHEQAEVVNSTNCSDTNPAFRMVIVGRDEPRFDAAVAQE